MTPLCQITRNGAARHALPTKFGNLLPAALYSNLKSVRPRTRKSAAYRCSNQDTLCPSFRCRSLVSLGGWFPAGPYSHPPSPLGVVSKGGPCPRPSSPVCGTGFPGGEGRSPRPLCQRGMGDGGVPHVSGGGPGRGLYAKGLFPLPHNGSYPLREQKHITILLNLQFLRHIVQIDGQDLADALFLHGDAVQHVGGLHGAPGGG